MAQKTTAVICLALAGAGAGAAQSGSGLPRPDGMRAPIISHLEQDSALQQVAHMRLVEFVRALEAADTSSLTEQFRGVTWGQRDEAVRSAGACTGISAALASAQSALSHVGTRSGGRPLAAFLGRVSARDSGGGVVMNVQLLLVLGAGVVQRDTVRLVLGAAARKWSAADGVLRALCPHD